MIIINENIITFAAGIFIRAVAALPHAVALQTSVQTAGVVAGQLIWVAL